MKRIIVLLIVMILTGCTNETKENITEPIGEVLTEENYTKEEYIDDNPIKLGLFLYNNKYSDKKVLKDTYYTDFISGADIGSFEVFLTDDEVINGTNFKNTWYKYFNMYDAIDNYKVGFNIKFILSDGTDFNSNFLEPDIYKFSEYFYVYLYDDINQEDGAVYSHLEKMEDNTLLTSIKIYAVDGIDEVENFILSVFTYNDEKDFDEEGNYRGSSITAIRIKRK